MYEGKHIHFSEVDQKPLCSYSAKLCKQRRLNGYAFCIRHVLEDKSAPFRQCEFVAKYNRLRCTNPIPGEENRKFCNSHMQVLGLAPKKTKKRKSENSPDLRNDMPSGKGDSQEREKHKKKSKDKKKKKKKKKKDKHKNKADKSNHKDAHVNSKSSLDLDDLSYLCGSMPPEFLHVLPRVDSVIHRVTSVEKSSRTKSRRRKDGSTLQDRLQEKLERNKQRLRLQREKEMLAKTSRHSKLDDKVSSSHISPSLSDDGLQYSASYLDTQRLFPVVPPIVAGKGRVPSIPWPHMMQRAPSPQEAFVKLQQKRPRDLFARKLDSPAVDRLRERLQTEEVAGTDLFPLGLEFSDEEDQENEEVSDRRHRYTYKEQYSLSSSSSTEENTPLSRNDRLKQLKTHLQRGCRKAMLSLHCDRLERTHLQRSSKLLVNAAREHPFGAAVSRLRVQEQTLQRPKVQSPPERICCSKEENGDPCQEESMPYSKHCFRHILEDEEQVLFYQCSAEFPGGFRCIEPSFDMLNEQPLCLEHAKRVRMQPKQKRPRKKTKPSALTRPFKKKKKNQRRKVRPQKPIPPAEPLQNYHMPISTTVPIAPNPPAPAPFRSPSPLGAHDIPDHLPDHLMDISALEVEEADLNVDSPNEEMNSEAEEEALSSILPNLNDLFGGRNGDFIPTKEEAEALERALFQASEEVNEAKASLEQLQFPPEGLLLDEGDCESANSLPADVTEAAISQDSSDGLPSDLQSAANRLIADTIRQNSNDATHNSIHPSSNLANSVPLSGLSATQPVQQAFSLPSTPQAHPAYTNTVVQFNGTMIPQTQALLTPNALATNTVPLDHNHHDALRPLNPVLNGLITGNQRAMLPQFPVTQSLTSPHGQQVPHPMLSPHSPQIVTTTLPQTSPNANPGISPNPSASTQVSQPTALPSFRQTWSTTLPNIQNALLRNNGNIPNVNGLNSSSPLQFGTQMVTQAMCSPKLPSFNTVVAGITQNHLQPQQFSSGLPSPQPSAGIPTPPFTASSVNSITPPIKQQGT